MVSELWFTVQTEHAEDLALRAWPKRRTLVVERFYIRDRTYQEEG
jgi:hypothetical protein